MSEPKEDDKAEKNQAPEPRSKVGSSIGKLLLVVVIALISSAGGGLMSWFLITKTMKAEANGGASEAADPATHKQDQVAEAIEKGGALPLEPFVVNLADADAARYLRIRVSLMVDDKLAIKELSENTALQMKVRDVILQMLTVKTSKDLISEEGKARLREEIEARITGYFKHPKLVDVMFTEFVIQL